jgi:hypothetical protein
METDWTCTIRRTVIQRHKAGVQGRRITIFIKANDHSQVTSRAEALDVQVHTGAYSVTNAKYLIIGRICST